MRNDEKSQCLNIKSVLHSNNEKKIKWDWLNFLITNIFLITVD